MTNEKEETPEEYLKPRRFSGRDYSDSILYRDALEAVSLARKQEQEKYRIHSENMAIEWGSYREMWEKEAFERGKKAGLQISAATDPFFLRDQITKEIQARVRQENAKFILKEIEKLTADFKEQKGYSGREGYILNHLRLFIETEYLSAPEKKEEKNDRKKNP